MHAWAGDGGNQAAPAEVGNAAPLLMGWEKGRIQITLCFSQSQLRQTRHAGHRKPGHAGSNHGSNGRALGSSSPSYAGLWLFGLTSLQSFAMKGNTWKKISFMLPFPLSSSSPQYQKQG